MRIRQRNGRLGQADVVAAAQACMRLIALYTHYIDLGQANLVGDLFIADGIWEAPKKKLTGQAEIRSAFALREQLHQRNSRHICTNSVVNVLSPTDASGLTYFTLYRWDKAFDGERPPVSLPWAVGDYRDQFCCVDGEWCFAHRVVTFAFGGPKK